MVLYVLYMILYGLYMVLYGLYMILYGFYGDLCCDWINKQYADTPLACQERNCRDVWHGWDDPRQDDRG